MNRSVQDLIAALRDPRERASARKQLVALGPDAVDNLLGAFAADTDAPTNAIVLSILVELRDSRAEAAFRAGLASADENVRSLAAQGLFALGSRDALDAALRTIDDAPDPLHFDVTPSVRTLSAMGVRALPSVLPLLLSAEPRIRQRAQKVLEIVTSQVIAGGGRGVADANDRAWRALWEANGSYRWDGPAAARAESVRRWGEWVRSHDLS